MSRTLRTGTQFALVALLAAGLLAAIPTATACTIVPSAFESAAWTGPEAFAATFRTDVIHFDLGTGTHEPLAKGFFAGVAAGPDDRVAAVGLQEGLGAMCEGDRYLDFHDADNGERLHRLAGHGTPMAASSAGLVTGVDGLMAIRFYPWASPLDWHEVETGLGVGHGQGVIQAAALRSLGDVLAVLARDAPTLRFVDVERGGPYEGLDPLPVAGDPLKERPWLAFEPAGTRLALLFSSEGRDRVVLYDVKEQEATGVLNVQAAWLRPSLAWTESGIATTHADRVRHVDIDGTVRVAVLDDGDEAKNVVAEAHGRSWVVLVANPDAGHRVLHFEDAGTPVEQWRWDNSEEAWHRTDPETWIRFSDETTDDPAWVPPGPGSGDLSVDPGDDEPETRTVPAPAVVVIMAAITFAFATLRCGAPRAGERPRRTGAKRPRAG